MAPDIRFPNIGIEINELNRVAFSVFGVEIYWYSVCIIAGIIAGCALAIYYGNKDKMDTEKYLDFAVYALIFSIIGARLYFVIFSWDQYKDNLLRILNFRAGGLAIYGGVAAGVLTAVIFCKKHKWDFFKFADTVMPGLLAGQSLGRWGNFINREAFGDFTNAPLAMQLKLDQVRNSDVTKQILENIVTYKDVEYIQVHPTFFYESMWNLALIIVLHFYRKHKKFDGEIFCLYFLGYGIGRFWIEGLRTDQLMLFGTGLAVSRALSLVLAIGALIAIIYGRRVSDKKALSS